MYKGRHNRNQNRNYKQSNSRNSKTNVKNYNVVLEDLQDYMLHNENMEKYKCIVNTNYKTIDKTVKKNKKMTNIVKDVAGKDKNKILIVLKQNLSRYSK